jgi:hypothetical protein
MNNIDNINKLTTRLVIDKLDNVTVLITNKELSFSYTIADAVVKEEFKGKYKYLGGLQCNYDSESEMYNLLEQKLCLLAENVLLVK